MIFGPTPSEFSSVEMEAIFLETFSPWLSSRQFEYCGKNRWVRQATLPFKHLFYLYPFRPGADYYPHGAISFDYVPRIESGKIKLRAGAKYARVHLGVVHPQLGGDCCISRNKGTARQKCQEIAEPVVEHITNALSKLDTFESVIALFERTKHESVSGFYIYPETNLSFAFTLAKSGRETEARAELLRTLQSPYFPQEVHGQIADCLNSTLAGES